MRPLQNCQGSRLPIVRPIDAAGKRLLTNATTSSERVSSQSAPARARRIRLALACLLMATLGSFCPTALAQKSKTKKGEPPLPPLNEKVVAFAREQVGRQVGDGECLTLAIQALQKAGARVTDFTEPNGDYEWGERINDFKDVRPGDILQFRDARFKGQRPVAGVGIVRWQAEYPHHTAVVASVERSGKLIKIYHQNTLIQGQNPDDKRKVKLGELQMDALQRGGWVRAYRPTQAASSSPKVEPSDPPRPAKLD